MEFLVIGAVGFLFGGFYGAAVAIVGTFILGVLLAVLFDN
jgi:hypothetical protein